jgi:hypothetical protein
MDPFEYIQHLVDERRADLRRLETTRSLHPDDYLTCRRALETAIRELQTVLEAPGLAKKQPTSTRTYGW